MAKIQMLELTVFLKVKQQFLLHTMGFKNLGAYIFSLSGISVFMGSNDE